MLIFFFIFFFGLLSVYIWQKLKGPSLYGLLLKSLTTLVLIVASIYLQSNNLFDPNLGEIVTIALLFGLLGDIFLDLKLIYTKDNDFYTFAGFGAFIAGHLFYIFHFLSNYQLAVFTYSIPFALAGIVVFIVLVTEIPLQMNYGKFRVISSVYAFILSFITFFSIVVGYKYGSNQLLFFSLGMVLFLLSDLILSQSYFGKEEKPWMIISNYILYYGAQFLFVLSLW